MFYPIVLRYYKNTFLSYQFIFLIMLLVTSEAKKKRLRQSWSSFFVCFYKIEKYEYFHMNLYGKRSLDLKKKVIFLQKSLWFLTSTQTEPKTGGVVAKQLLLLDICADRSGDLHPERLPSFRLTGWLTFAHALWTESGFRNIFSYWEKVKIQLK